MFFLIIGAAGIGYARSLELTRSQKNLESLLQLLLLLKGEIRCANSTLPDAFREIADKIRDPFGHILREAAEVMEKADGQTLEEIMCICGEKELGGRSRDRREEVEVLRSLGCRLGYLDKEMQIRQIEFLENNLEVRRNQLREKDLPDLRNPGRHFACCVVLVRGEGGERGSHHYFQNSGGRDPGFHPL